MCGITPRLLQTIRVPKRVEKNNWAKRVSEEIRMKVFKFLKIIHPQI